MIAPLLVALALAGEPAPPPSSACMLDAAPDGEAVTVRGEIRLVGDSPIVVTHGLEPPPPAKKAGALLLKVDGCTDREARVVPTPAFNESIMAFAFYLMLDTPSGRDGQAVAVQGVWRAADGVIEADAIGLR